MFNKILKEQKKEEKREEVKEETKQPPTPPKMRQIIIETDGNGAKIVKAEVAGSLELKAILTGLANSLK